MKSFTAAPPERVARSFRRPHKPSIKNALSLLAVIAAYWLTAYWDADEEQDRNREGELLARMAPDESPSHDNAPTTHGVQHAHR